MNKMKSAVLLAALMAASSIAAASDRYKLEWWSGNRTFYKTVTEGRPVELAATFTGDVGTDPEQGLPVITNIRDLDLSYFGEPVPAFWQVSAAGSLAPAYVGMTSPVNVIAIFAPVVTWRGQTGSFHFLFDMPYSLATLFPQVPGVWAYPGKPASLCFRGNCNPSNLDPSPEYWRVTDLGPVTSPVPEPSSAAMFGIALLGYLAVRRKRSAS